MDFTSGVNLVCLSKDRDVFAGFICIRGKEFPIQIEVPVKGDITTAVVHCSWKMKQILGDSIETIQQRLESSSSIHSFAMELQDILDRKLQATENYSLHTLLPSLFYSDLIKQLDSFGWESINHMDKNMTEIQVKIDDENNRSHILQLNFLPTFPLTAPILKHNLPSSFEITWSKQSTVNEIIDRFREKLKVHQLLWNTLDEIDQETWVLEPENPNVYDCYRRIYLGNNSSVLITINPNYPLSLPDCKFLGSDKVIGPLQKRLNENANHWDLEESILSNLRLVLDITFPVRDLSQNEELTIECGICYSYRCNDSVPDKSCDNSRCNRAFHSACLYEWLRSIPNPRQSFNTIFGECLYCDTPISCKMPCNK